MSPSKCCWDITFLETPFLAHLSSDSCSKSTSIFLPTDLCLEKQVHGHINWAPSLVTSGWDQPVGDLGEDGRASSGWDLGMYFPRSFLWSDVGFVSNEHHYSSQGLWLYTNVPLLVPFHLLWTLDEDNSASSMSLVRVLCPIFLYIHTWVKNFLLELFYFKCPICFVLGAWLIHPPIHKFNHPLLYPSSILDLILFVYWVGQKRNLP